VLARFADADGSLINYRQPKDRVLSMFKKGCFKMLLNETNKPQFSGKILVAEDSIGCQVLIRKTLNSLGFEVETADNGKEALQKVFTGQYDIILMDMQMPYMNGYEATAALREKEVKTPIIALTAYAMVEDRDKCLKAGCDDYLSKPLDNERLLEIFGKYLPAQAKV
jgi:CheY-like chemotaxis protein